MTTEELYDKLKLIQKMKCETQNLELKSAEQGYPKRLYDSLSSFSNQDDGGIIVFGIDEKQDYKEVGVYDAQDIQKKINEQCLQMNPVVRPLITVVEKENKKFVSAEIPGIDLADRPCYYQGRGRLKGSYTRIGDSDEPMTEYEIYSYEAWKAGNGRISAGCVEELEIDAYGECEKMTYYNREDQFLRQRLQKEIPILRALIQNLYEELDRKLHLNGAKVPITFGYDTDTLGSYTRRSAHEKEHFHFSLLFIAYGVKNPLSKEDRIDLFKHEYAHYMQYNMQIPEKYKWQAGTHGSAWKYCCSLIGAAPTPYYKAGEALMNHDYDKVLKNRIHDKSVPVRDTYQQLKTAQKKKDEVVQYKLGDAVTHPKFGHGIVEKINQRSGGVHLHIRFDGEVKCIDQKWLSRKKYM